jgi:membrane-associated phospholipid phosphatase
LHCLVVAAWAAAIAGAFYLDADVAWRVHGSRLEHVLRAHWWMVHIIRFLGNYFFTLAIVALLCGLDRISWRAGLFVCICGALSGVNVLFKWGVGRTRPYRPPNISQPAPFVFEPFRGGIWGLRHESNLSFISGDACLAFALAAAMACVFPRWRLLFYGWAALVAVERVAENAHYVSDVVAGAAVGILVVYWFRKFFDPAGTRSSQAIS